MSDLPEVLADIRDDFLALEVSDRLVLLLEFANGLPALPAEYADHPDLLERVVECQAPVFIFVDVDPAGRVTIHATAPPEAPTTRGFASIIVQGLSGLDADAVLAIDHDFPQTLGLGAAISPLRLRGMTALLARVKRQVREKTAA